MILGGCGNTGELAPVFDHEWGHGMDFNDVNGGIAQPSGEGIAGKYIIYISCHVLSLTGKLNSISTVHCSCRHLFCPQAQ